MIKFNLKSLSGAGPRHIKIAVEAVLLLETVVNSVIFAELVKNDPFFKEWRSGYVTSFSGSPMKEFIALVSQDRDWELDFCIDLEVQLAIKLESHSRVVDLQPNIETAFWLIDDCIRRHGPIGLACHWLYECLQKSPREKTPGPHREETSIVDPVAEADKPDIADAGRNPRRADSREAVLMRTTANRLAAHLRTAATEFARGTDVR